MSEATAARGIFDDQPIDYIIIGTGAAGSVLANRLSADLSCRVLVLEAGGPDHNKTFHDIGSLNKLWGSEADWGLVTESQTGLGGRQITINQGKVLGGSTSINAMMYVRGNRRNFDQWQAMGATGWGYEEILPFFKQSENYEEGLSPFHGTGGELSIRICPENAMRCPEFIAAAEELGFAGSPWDYNGDKQEDGAGFLQFHIDPKGHRASGATAFLAPIQAHRPNLTITLHAQVTRILMEGSRAIGVEYIKEGKQYQARADREIILSAGALHSPQLLMLSGIGPAQHLLSAGIPTVIDLPGVGQNLQDHLQLPIIFRSREHPQTELLTGNMLFTNTRTSSPDAAPDLQLNFTPATPKPLAELIGIPFPICIFLPILVQPLSRGEVRLRSADPVVPPVVDPHYLEDTADMQTLKAAVALVRDLAHTQAFQPLNHGEIAPGEAELEGFIRSQCSTLWHPVGSCRIGSETDPDAVVDPQLRVRGVENLRVADASVMPIIPSGNTVAASFMIGEKLAASLTQPS